MEMILNFITNNSELVLLGTVTLIEISPIQVNPWKWIGKWLGNIIIGDLKDELSTLKKEFEENRANTIRWNILNFARDCRKGEQHSEEEWNHLVSQLKTYETICKEKHIENGVIEETAVYLRELYHHRLHKNDFL